MTDDLSREAMTMVKRNGGAQGIVRLSCEDVIRLPNHAYSSDGETAIRVITCTSGKGCINSLNLEKLLRPPRDWEYNVQKLVSKLWIARRMIDLVYYCCFVIFFFSHLLQNGFASFGINNLSD